MDAICHLELTWNVIIYGVGGAGISLLCFHVTSQ